MKRIIALLLALMLLVSIVACAPSQPTQTPGEDSTQQPSPTDPEDKDPSAPADNVLLDSNAEANEDILPRGVDKNHKWVKELKDQTLTLYYAAKSDAFSYRSGKSNITETTWLRRLKDEYDITIHAVRKDESSSLAAQRLALLSGKQLDLLCFTPGQLPYALGMTTDAATLMETEGYDFLNQAILSYGNDGKRFFSPVGIARNLWYTVEGKTSPLSMSESQLWDQIAFSNYVSERTVVENENVKVYGYEAQDFTDFLAAMGTPVIRFEDRFINSLPDAKENITILQKLNSNTGYYYNGQSRSNAPALINGTLAMRYGQTPFVGSTEKYPEFCWAPLPNAKRYEGKGYVSACAPVLALPKDGPKNQVALYAALLWTARMADANHDTLRFTYGLSFENWTKYYHATNQQLQIVCSGSGAMTAALRRLAGSATFEESDYTQLLADTKTYCINANERL